jgi:Polysaccharide lyase
MRRPFASSLALVATVVLTGSAAQAQHRGSGAGQVYFVGDFETCDFSQWWRQVGPTNAFRIARSQRAQGRCAGTLTVGSQAKGTWNGRSDATAVAAPGRPPDYGTSGRTVWQHFSILFPARFRATLGDWNWFTEWHNDEGFKGQVRSEFPNLCWTIRNSRGVGRIAMRIIGGQSRAPRTIWVMGPRLKRNHWYDFLVRTTWSPSASQGFVQWWLDGKRMFSKQAATLYTRPNGSVSSVYFMQDYYRLHARWTAKIFLDGTRLGSTRESVRYPA